MTEKDMLDLMAKFRIAYAKCDEETLAAITTDDFEWHQHAGKGTSDQPTGKILKGVAALAEEIRWRRENWQETKYENLEERSAGDLLVQTFTISGKEQGRPFHAKAVDLYPVRDGKIARKDTYWKYTR